MTTPTASPLSRRSELVSLAERMGALQALRLCMVAVVVVAASLAPDLAGASTRSLVPLAAGYAALQVTAELVRRIAGGRGLAVVGAMLLCDGAFVTAVLYRTGGPASYLSFLVELHLIAVSLLVSYRTGLKLALWYTVLFSVGHYAHAAGLLPGVQAGRAVVGGFGRSEIFGLLAFWLVAVATAVFSSLNERELRRSKVQLRALAALSAELTENLSADRVPELLLDRLLTTFGMVRGAVVLAEADHLAVTTMAGREVVRRVEGTGPWPDAVARQAVERRAPVLLRQLGRANPVLDEALAGARNVIVLSLTTGSEVLGVVALERGGRPTLGVPSRTLEMLGQFTAHGALALRTAALHSEVRRLATTDSLTGLFNRRVFDEALDREVARAVRRGSAMSLVLIDVDHFKAVNDNHGHQVGDEVLRAVGHAVQHAARSSDVAARFGGEEFVLLLPDCGQAEAVLAAERLRLTIARAPSPVKVTASAGVAVVRGGTGQIVDRSALLRAADEALYASKRAGRDRTTVYGSRRRRPARVGEPQRLAGARGSRDDG